MNNIRSCWREVAVELMRLAALAGALLATGSALGQSYPVKPIRIVVPFVPGGPNDVLARMFGQWLTAAWGHPVVVDNRPGGGTVIGTELVAKAPDGHTLLMVSTSHAANPSLGRKLPYDMLRDFVAVIHAVSMPNMLVAHPSLPVRTVNELVALAKARPGQIIFSSGGSGTSTHLAGELLRLTAKVEMTHVAYKGTSPSLVALMSGEVSWTLGNIMPMVQHVKSGKLRAIAVSSGRRVAILPEVPTVAEDLPGFEVTAWYGVFAPASTPADIVARLNKEIARGLTTPEVRERFAREATEVVASSPEDFASLFRSEMGKWARVIKAAKIKLE